jgi:hypothetical protein
MTTIDPRYSQEHTNGAHDTVAPEPIDLVAGAADLETRATSVLKELHAAIEASKARTARLVSVLAHMIGVPGAAELSTVLARAPAPPKRVRKPAKANAAAPKRGPKAKGASVASRVLASLEKVGALTGAQLTQGLEVKSTAVQSALHALLKAGKVKHVGKGRERVWSVA